jgi:PiT family inorganic phosphate transporter
MGWPLAVLLGTALVAYANGANDNFKGVATLFGSQTTDYRRALVWANVATFAGSLTSVFLAARLIRTFSGKGLVPDNCVSDPAFLMAVILGAGLAVLLAARLGIPISTTHSLTGALVGSGFVAVGLQINGSALWRRFFMPLLCSPLIAMALTIIVYGFVRWLGRSCGLTESSCVCVSEQTIPVGALALERGGSFSTAAIQGPKIVVGEAEDCANLAARTFRGTFLGIETQNVIDSLHFLSAGALSFARGLNDTPKIVALSLSLGAVGLSLNIGLVALAMALGAFLAARPVAETMSLKITSMSHTQGLISNLVASALVIFASHAGFPVSTTHVSCGSLFGIGLAGGRADGRVIRNVVSAWVLTLPIAALLAGGCFMVLRGLT